MQVEFAHSLRSGVLEEWEERRKRMKEKVKKKKKNKRGAHTHCKQAARRGKKGGFLLIGFLSVSRFASPRCFSHFFSVFVGSGVREGGREQRVK